MPYLGLLWLGDLCRGEDGNKLWGQKKQNEEKLFKDRRIKTKSFTSLNSQAKHIENTLPVPAGGVMILSQNLHIEYPP